MIFNNPTDRPASYETDGHDPKTSGLVRLVEDPDIIKTIRFDEMFIEGAIKNYDVQGGGNPTDVVGLAYPIIRINDVIVAMRNISYMNISLSGFIPTIRLGIIYEDETFIDKNMPKDGDILSLFLRTDTDALQYLRDEFIITSCSVNRSQNAGYSSKINIIGKLFIPGFDSAANTNGFTGSSKSVLKQVAKSYGIGFAFNDYDDTNDFQTWIQCRESSQSFINSVVSHSWKNNTSFFTAWIDLYYNLCYCNVNKFLLSGENKEDIDVTFSTNIMYMYNQLNMDTSVGKSEAHPKILSNSTAFFSTPFFITKWTPVNNSTSISFNNGYSTITRTYLHNQNLINSDDEKCFVSLENIPAYDKEKTDVMIILRGRAKYDKGKNPENERARVNYNFVDTYVRDEWTGIEYVLDDDDNKRDSMKWSGNVHKNYNNAVYHNIQNINEINKIYIKVECSGLCLQIMKGERIPVILIHESTMEEDKYNNFSKNDLPSDINRFYSGYYIVDSVEYDYAPIKAGDISPYKTTFVLKRREWPTPEAI